MPKCLHYILTTNICRHSTRQRSIIIEIKMHHHTHLTFLSFVTSVCKYSSALAVWRAILTLISQGSLCCPLKSLRNALRKSLCIFGYIRQQGFLKGDITFSNLMLFYHLNLCYNCTYMLYASWHNQTKFIYRKFIEKNVVHQRRNKWLVIRQHSTWLAICLIKLLSHHPS